MRYAINAMRAGLVMAVIGAHAHGQAIVEQPSLTLDVAVKMVNACEALARSNGWKISMWVVDDAGVAVHTKHMQGARSQAIQAAQKKAETSRQLGASTDPADAKSAVAKLVKNPTGQAILASSNYYPEGGGMPVIVDGKIAGAIGVAGVTGAQAAECAQAAVRVVTK
jgi:glc operon protein GlcG